MDMCIGNSESNASVSQVLVRPISIIVLLVESNKEGRSPTVGPQSIHLVKIIIDDLERGH